MAVYFIKQFDLAPVLPFSGDSHIPDAGFKNDDGSPYDLTGKTVKLTMQQLTGGTPTVNAQSGAIDTPVTRGTGHYAWQNHDTDATGHYRAHWVTSDGTTPQTFPRDGYHHIFITPVLS